MTTKELAERLELKSLTRMFEKPVSGVYISDMVSDVIANAKAGNVLVTLQVHNNVIAAANLVDVSAIVLTRGRTLPAEAISLAERAEIPVFSTNMDSWQVATRLYEAGIR
jgi:predicted transcriptional regulator